MNIKESGSKKNTPKNDRNAARRQELGNFLNKRLANTADGAPNEGTKARDQATKPDLIQTLMDAAKKEEAKNLSQLDQGYIGQVEVALGEIDKVYEIREMAKKQKSKGTAVIDTQKRFDSLINELYKIFTMNSEKILPLRVLARCASLFLQPTEHSEG